MGTSLFGLRAVILYDDSSSKDNVLVQKYFDTKVHSFWRKQFLKCQSHSCCCFVYQRCVLFVFLFTFRFAITTPPKRAFLELQRFFQKFSKEIVFLAQDCSEPWIFFALLVLRALTDPMNGCGPGNCRYKRRNFKLFSDDFLARPTSGKPPTTHPTNHPSLSL